MRNRLTLIYRGVILSSRCGSASIFLGSNDSIYSARHPGTGLECICRGVGGNPARG